MISHNLEVIKLIQWNYLTETFMDVTKNIYNGTIINIKIMDNC